MQSMILKASLLVAVIAAAVAVVAVLAGSTLQGASRPGIALADGDGRITTVTLQYKDFGLGTPVDITLEGNNIRGHFSPGGDDNHGPISVAADGTFTVVKDSSRNGLNPRIELRLVAGSSDLLIKIHTSCSQPIEVGFLYGPDGDDGADDPSEFGSSGFTAGLEVTAGDGCIKGPTATPPPTATPVTPTATPVTPTETPVTPTATPVTPTETPISEVSPTIVMPSPTPPKEKGDVNCDGSVTIEDAQLIGQLLLGLIDELPCPDQADVNKDGRTSINDAQLISQLVLGTIPDFGY